MTYSEIKKPLLDKCSTLLTIACIFLLVSLITSSTTLYSNTAFGDGLFMEELSASFGERKADLIIKMTPPKQNQKPIIQFKLYDPTTNEGYKHVTYYITIEKDGKKLLSDWFHDHKGDLKIEMKSSDAEEITVYVAGFFVYISRMRKGILYNTMRDYTFALIVSSLPFSSI